MGKLYLVRHGETVANAGGRLQGWMDAELNDKGRTQARETAAYYKNIHLDAVYCSTLKRARETAEILLRPMDCRYMRNRICGNFILASGKV